jgi:hypothetical protein
MLVSNLNPAANLAFDPLPIPLSPMTGGSIVDVIQHLPPMSGGNLADAIQHLPPMSGGNLGDLIGSFLSGSGQSLHPSFPNGRQTVG